MLLVAGSHRDLIRYVLDQLVRIHYAVLVFVGRASEALNDVVAEDAVAAAELRTFDRDLLRTARQQSEKIAFGIAQMLDVGVHGGVVNGTDDARLADIHEQDYAADLLQLLLKQRLSSAIGSAVLFRSCGSES